MSATVRFHNGWADVALRCDACQKLFAAVLVAVHPGRPDAAHLAANQARALGAYYHGLDVALHGEPGTERCDAHTCGPCRAAGHVCRCEACDAARRAPALELAARLAELNQPTAADAADDPEPW